MSRSLKKGPYVDENVLKKVTASKPGKGLVIKTWARDCTIIPEMIGFEFEVHNGKGFTKFVISDEMVGHKLGEFSHTRKFIKHGGKIQKDIEQSKK